MNSSANMPWTKMPGRGLIILAGLMLACGHESRPRVVMETEMGDIILEIYTREAPVTAGNFLELVERRVYDSALFYRVVRPDNQPDNHVRIEVIQGGLYRDELIEVHAPIRHETTKETGILHFDGVLSMARNEPGSASTEFFICVGDQHSLDYGGKRNPDGQGFAAFGKVVEGMEVVRAIQALPDSGQYLPGGILIRSVRSL